jgi:hypothetical protein
MQYYKHFKGNYYRLIGEARHSETLEELVVYQALYGDQMIWVRPKAMFYENVTLSSGQVVPRFAPCTEEEAMEAQKVVKDEKEVAFQKLLKSLFHTFVVEGVSAEDFGGGCGLLGEANEFMLDEIEENVVEALPKLSKFDRERMVNRLYSELYKMFDENERRHE